MINWGAWRPNFHIFHRHLIGFGEVMDLFFTIRLHKGSLCILVCLIFLIIAVILYRGRSAPAVQTLVVSSRAAAPTLVIDPGHGGADGGASSADGMLESEVNLAIALRLHALCRLCAIPCTITRESEALPYPADCTTIRAKKVWDQHTRLQVVESTPHAVLLSIHQNAFTGSAHGATAIYADTEESRALATAVLSQLNRTCLGVPDRSPTPAPDSIYLLKSVSCPAALAECGFLTNRDDAALLASETHRLELAAALLAGYITYLQGEAS